MEVQHKRKNVRMQKKKKWSDQTGWHRLSWFYLLRKTIKEDIASFFLWRCHDAADFGRYVAERVGSPFVAAIVYGLADKSYIYIVSALTKSLHGDLPFLALPKVIEI